MSKYLVIVESPTKAKTISSILGKDYEVISSMGHIIDLPTKKLSVDIENGFSPAYRVIPGKEKIINQLKKKAKGKKIIYLATDPDREGEAISWHIRQELSKNNEEFRRVIFHEITEEALWAAFKNYVDLDMDKVNAQIARRVLDRIVGYNLSPLLWKKIVRGLSAGRVQSVALKFIVEREREITQFIPKTTFSIGAEFKVDSCLFGAQISKYKGKQIIFESKESALACIEKIRNQKFTVRDVIIKQVERKPLPPYITSLLQQDAFNRLKFSAQKTMLLAQKLYEGVQIGSKSIGLITYMRTDSFHISQKAKKETKDFILNNFCDNYLSPKEYRYKAKKGAQLANEAIRPTSVSRRPEDLAGILAEDELKLYDLIWRRFVASFMKESVYESTKAFIASEEAEFEASGRKLVFEGFLKIFGEEQEAVSLPNLKKGQNVLLEKLEVVEHTTKPPPRYNDASLVRLLEEKGIGRPSTYVPTIFTLIKRHYTKREKRVFIPTNLGMKVNDLLVKFFPQIMDESFTALMEEQLDEVEKGELEWNKILKDFYPQFKEKVDASLALAQKEFEVTDKTCPQCKAKLIIKWSRRGRFLSCENFPRCRYAESITTGVNCPACKVGQLIERRNKRGQNFYGCSKFPNCTYTSRNLPSTDQNTQETSSEAENNVKADTAEEET